MLGIIAKLIHILTLSPFSDQTGLWRVAGLENDLDDEGNEELPSSKHETGMRLRRSVALDHLKTLSDALVRRGLEKTTIGQAPGVYRASPWEDLLESVIGLLITRMTLSYSENQTIIFLVGFSHVGFLITALLLIVELVVGQERTGEYLEVMDLVYRFTNISTALFLLAIIAKIYYSVFPPPIPEPLPYPIVPYPAPVPLPVPVPAPARVPGHVPARGSAPITFPQEKSMLEIPYPYSAPVHNGQNQNVKNQHGF